jgi:hypothetical protein
LLWARQRCRVETASDLNRPGDRGWVKIKNREYWRYEMERESAMNRPRQRTFI